LRDKETEFDALIKLGDYYYFGLQPLEVYGGQSVLKAEQIYKYIQQFSTDNEIKGQALFNLGIIYHFGVEEALKSPKSSISPVSQEHHQSIHQQI